MTGENIEALEPMEVVELTGCHVARIHHGALEWVATSVEVFSMSDEAIIGFQYHGDWDQETAVEGDTFKLCLEEEHMNDLLKAFAARHPNGIALLGEAIAHGAGVRRGVAQSLTSKAASTGHALRQFVSGDRYEAEDADLLLQAARELHEGIGGVADGSVEQLWEVP